MPPGIGDLDPRDARKSGNGYQNFSIFFRYKKPVLRYTRWCASPGDPLDRLPDKRVDGIEKMADIHAKRTRLIVEIIAHAECGFTRRRSFRG